MTRDTQHTHTHTHAEKQLTATSSLQSAVHDTLAVQHRRRRATPHRLTNQSCVVKINSKLFFSLFFSGFAPKNQNNNRSPTDCFHLKFTHNHSFLLILQLRIEEWRLEHGIARNDARPSRLSSTPHSDADDERYERRSAKQTAEHGASDETSLETNTNKERTIILHQAGQG